MSDYSDLNIAAAAVKAGKITKREAQKVVKTLYLSAETNEERGMLAQLYQFFMPPRPRQPKTNFDWVSMAQSKKDKVNEFKRYAYVTEDWVMATDGHRLHRVPNKDGLTPGYYNRAGDFVHSPDHILYPNVDRIIPDVTSLEPVAISPESLEVVEVVETGTANTIVCYRVLDDVLVDKRYLDEAIGAQKALCYQKPDSKLNPLLFVVGERQALIALVRGK